MTWHRSFVLFMLFVVLITLSACKDTNKIIETTTLHIELPIPNEEAPTTVIVDNLFIKTTEGFETLHPNIKIVIDHLPPEQFIGKEQLKRLKSNESPDIVPFDNSYLRQAQQEGALVDLSLFENADWSKSDVFPGILDISSVKGQLLVMPYGAFPTVILYNKAVFDQEKIPYPQNNWTWEDYNISVKKFTITAKPFLPLDLGVMDIMMESLGKGIISPEDGYSIGYLDSEEAIHTLQWLKTYNKESANFAIENQLDAGKLFNGGKLSMIIGNLDAYTFYKTNLGEDLGVVSLPYFEGGKRANSLYIQGLGISANSKSAAAAWEFIKYFSLTKNDNTDEFANHYLMTSQSMTEITHQNTDPVKSIFMNELNFAVKPSIYRNPLFNQVWDKQTPNLYTQFQSLQTAEDDEVANKLHELAIKVDQELKLAEENARKAEQK